MSLPRSRCYDMFKPSGNEVPKAYSPMQGAIKEGLISSLPADSWNLQTLQTPFVFAKWVNMPKLTGSVNIFIRKKGSRWLGLCGQT